MHWVQMSYIILEGATRINLRHHGNWAEERSCQLCLIRRTLLLQCKLKLDGIQNGHIGHWLTLVYDFSSTICIIRETLWLVALIYAIVGRMNELEWELEEEGNHLGMHARIVIFKDVVKRWTWISIVVKGL